uniref:Vacuolar protein sorting-associated protein 8 central domain-containing protein n=1 Tax=Romanomermis culicivorax TaxID=13658 RepID=A0A915K9W9_ROMCU
MSIENVPNCLLSEKITSKLAEDTYSQKRVSMMNILTDSVFNSTFIGNDPKRDKSLDQNAEIFDLSSTQSIQSLEEILKEPDPEPIDESLLADFHDDLSLNARLLEEIHTFDDNSDVTSIATTSSFSRDSTHASWKRPVRRKPKSQMLRCIRLRGISSQLLSANEKIRCGAPTSITVGCTHIAVGTAHGLTLLFDSKQILKFCIGHSKDAYDSGPVTSLCFNGEDSRLLIGFAKGFLLLYDLLKSTTFGLKLLRRCDVLSQLGNGILSAKFLNNDVLAEPAPPAIVNDAGGSVYILEWRGSPDKSCKCIFAGSKGDVCRAEPLTSTFFDSSLLALASLTKLIVLRLKPKIQVIFTMENKLDEASKYDIVQQAKSPPLVSWRPISTDGHHSEVQLAYGRSKTIHIIEVSKISKSGVEMPHENSAKNSNLRAVLLKKISLKVNVDTDICASYDAMLINMAWISAKCLLTLDQNERAKLYDVFGENEHCVECSDISHIQLVYSTATFKGLATGGNVSPAMAFMAENACFNSLAVYSYGPSTGQVIVLGHKAVFALSLSSWLDCVNALVYCNNETQAPDFMGAISLCLDYFTGRKKTGLSSASPPGDAKNEANEKSLSNRKIVIIQEKAVALLLEYVELSMVKFVPSCGKIETLQEYYRNIIPFCLETCFELQREDIIYTTLYERFGVDALAKGIFLECLDDYILDDRLVDPPPSLIQEFIAHMEREGLYSVIESCVVHLPVHCLDLHQVMTFCRDRNLYDAIIYIFNYGLMDYMTPMMEMLQILGEILELKDFLSDEDVRLGNKLLLYVTCCLNGRSYFTYRVSDMKKDELICEIYEHTYALCARYIVRI